MSFLAGVKPEFGYRRAFCFRSATGFTALGLRPSNGSNEVTRGVIFQVTETQLREFDRREKGYYRKLVPLEFVEEYSADRESRLGE